MNVLGILKNSLLLCLRWLVYVNDKRTHLINILIRKYCAQELEAISGSVLRCRALYRGKPVALYTPVPRGPRVWTCIEMQRGDSNAWDVITDRAYENLPPNGFLPSSCVISPAMLGFDATLRFIKRDSNTFTFGKDENILCALATSRDGGERPN